MPLINCKIILHLTWSSAVGKTEFKISDTKLYDHVVTLPTEKLVLKEQLIGKNVNLN